MTHFPVALRMLARGPWLTAVVPPHFALDPCGTLAGERLGTDWSVGAAGIGAALLIMIAAIVVSVMRARDSGLGARGSGLGKAGRI